jgi:putative ABC transport system ATP-binding protein
MSDQNHSPLIALRNVEKSYPGFADANPVLRGIDLEIGSGQFVAIMGKSGSGKSTLLNLIGGIDRPSSGDVIVAGAAIHQLSESVLARWRGKNVGVVFQFFQLLPTLTAVENVMLPMDFCNTRPAKERRPRALDLLELVGIPEQADKLPSALSGGQQQRAAIARALANDPQIIIADEPTGNLDSVTARVVLQLFRKLSDLGATVVIATHEHDIQGLIDRGVELLDGAIVHPGSITAAQSLQEAETCPG